MNNDDDTPSIGYGNPPVATRFRRGVSGNPKGRPKGHRNLKTAAQEIFVSPILVREGAKTRRITKFEAILIKQIERALQGEQRAAQAATQYAEKLGLLREEAGKPTWDLSKLTDDELRTLEHLISKMQFRT